MVDELTAIVGMKASNAKWELAQHRFQHRYQPCLTDVRRGAHHLKLRHFIDRVDMVQTFDSLQIALMYRVDPQVTRLSPWVRPAPLANGHLNRPRLLVEDPLLTIGPAFAQVV